MSVESFGFALVVAVFGILIVFGLLILLSGFMSGMRRVDRMVPTTLNGGVPASGKEQRIARRRVRPKGAARAGSDPDAPAESATQDWVIAAAVAYLLLEEAVARPEAGPWATGRSFREDPWLVHHIGDKR